MPTKKVTPHVTATSLQRTWLYLFAFMVFTFSFVHAEAQTTQSMPLSGGTLSWTVNQHSGFCGPMPGENGFTATQDGPFQFLYGGTTYSLTGGLAVLGPVYCGIGVNPTTLTFSVPNFGSSCSITFTPTTSAGAGTVTTPNCTFAPLSNGYITPKYVVVGVTYAPPGSNSYVQYTNTTSVGNTTTISNSFTNDVGFSVSDAMGYSIKAGGFVDGDYAITSTESTDYTQGSSSSTTTTISKASTVAYKTSGTPTQAPVNSDYDYIWLWLNPELLLNYTPPAGSNPGSIVLTGYGMDPNDPATGLPQAGVPYTAGPDVIEVQVGCLNGHFSCGGDLGWNNGEVPGSFVTSGLLARSWQSAANGYYWPAGEQSGLSFNDVCQILIFDPLATTPSQCPTQNDYTLLNSLPSTTSDGRFSKIPYPPNPIQYPVGGANESYSLVQTNTQSQSSGNSIQIKQAFSVSEKFATAVFWGLTSNAVTFKESDTLIWNYSTLNTLTTTTTLTDALSITGPPNSPTYPGNEPVEYIGYQDNTFGTFVFVPLDYCPSSTNGICTE